MVKWLLGALFALGAHFGASYLVPLDERSQREFAGLLKWFWPWADGDHGLLGTVTVSSGFPLAGFFIAVIAATLFILAGLAVMGWWVPFNWWRACAIAGAALLLILMLLFFGPTKIIPIAYSIFILWAAWTNWAPIASLR